MPHISPVRVYASLQYRVKKKKLVQDRTYLLISPCLLLMTLCNIYRRGLKFIFNYCAKRISYSTNHIIVICDQSKRSELAVNL